MGIRLKCFFILCTSVCIVLFFSVLVGCGGGTSSSANGNNNPSATPNGGSNGSGGGIGSGASGTGSGSGSTGSGSPGGSGSAGSGSAGSGSGGSSSGGGTGSSGSGSGSGGTGSGSGSAASFVSFVYTAGANAITGYGVNADGSLVAVPNSPYTANTNTYLVTNGADLYTANSSGNTLDIYSLNRSDGSLTAAGTVNALAGNPMSGALVSSLSMDHSGTSVYAGTNDGVGDNGFNLFQVGANGTLTQKQYFGSGEDYGGPLAFASNNKYLYGDSCYKAAWQLYGLQRASDGTLTSLDIGAQNGPPVVGRNNYNGYCPYALAASAKNYLAVSYASIGTSQPYQLETFAINSDGTLTAIATSQATTASNTGNGGPGAIAIQFDPTGTYLAVAGNGGVQIFAIDAGGNLSGVGTPQDAGVNFQNVAWDNSNHVFATSNNQLYIWNATNGQLSPATGSPYSGATGLIVLPLK